ncbi:MAG: aminotransferase class V-fold PLP-dependent enzyme [Pirellulales bacterium]
MANDLVDRFRAGMPVVGHRAYFDHAAVSPLPRPTVDAITRWLEQSSTTGCEFWPNWAREVEATRREVAGLLNAQPAEIAFTANTTSGISLIAEAWPWREGDNVVLPADEYPANQYPWINLHARGVEVRRIPMPARKLDLESLFAACDDRTRIVALSWVGFLNGWRTDVAQAAEMAHVRGAALLVDAIQGVGALPFDVRASNVDFVASNGQKWLLGPESSGYLYIRRDRLEELRPLGVGAHSVTQGNEYTRIETNWHPSAMRFEGGAWNMPGLLGLGQSVKLLRALDVAAIGERILNYTDELVARLRSLGAIVHTLRERRESNSGIVMFSLPDQDPLKVRQRCVDRGIILSVRAGKLRVSPHGYNDDDELDRIIEALS